MVDIAFDATKDWGHGRVPTCIAKWLTVCSNLAASLAAPHTKYTSSSSDVGAVNFVVLAGLPDRPTARCLLLNFFPAAYHRWRSLQFNYFFYFIYKFFGTFSRFE